MHIRRSCKKSIRQGLTWDERWLGPDKGLIACWENGRELSETKPELAQRAKKGELPISGWRGGVEKKGKGKQKKHGTLCYLAEWQGLRGDDLDIDPSEKKELTCSRTGMKVIYTDNVVKKKRRRNNND